jgi:Xaa-Pro aminopeptidase
VLEAVMRSARSGQAFAEAARAGAAALAPLADRAFFSGVYGYPVGAQFPPSWVAGSSFITRESEAVFEDDMVFHLPICLRKPGEWGMGFSETIRVTRAGAECITANDRALHEVD